ncbi:MAG TPA: hypothetical protein VFV10_18050 [Gammaproteobacteria bacterium]|nr:hypothetical protein [Gammaproteobacteria bacterium]
MRRAAPLVLCLAACLAAALRPAFADTHSVSYSDWTLSGDTATLKFILPATEAARLTGPAMPLVTVRKLQDYLVENLEVLGDGQTCPAVDQGYDLGRVDPLAVGAGFYGFEMFFRCAAGAPKAWVLRDNVLFEEFPAHVNFARIQVGDRFAPQLFTSGRQELRVASAGAPARAGAGRYFGLGMRHAAHNAWMLALVLGLMLIARRRVELLCLLGGLPIGYAAALGVSLAGWIEPRTALLDAFGAFLVVLVAAEICAREAYRTRVAAVVGAGLAAIGLLAIALGRIAPGAVAIGAALLAASFLTASEDATPRRAFWLAAGALPGFIDGFVLPAELARLPFGAADLLPMQVGFYVGAIATLALLYAAVTAGAHFLRRRALVPSPALLADVSSATLAGLGAFWLLNQLYA